MRMVVHSIQDGDSLNLQESIVSRRLIKRVLFFIIAIQLVGFLGCSFRPQPKAMVSVEKPPMRVVIVDDENDIDPATVLMIMKFVGIQPYQNYQFNEFTGLGVEYNAQHHRAETRAVDIGVK